MLIFVDVQSGTWENADDIVLVEASKEVIFALESVMSDTDICEYGNEYGKPVVKGNV